MGSGGNAGPFLIGWPGSGNPGITLKNVYKLLILIGINADIRILRYVCAYNTQNYINSKIVNIFREKRNKQQIISIYYFIYETYYFFCIVIIMFLFSARDKNYISCVRMK